MKRQFPAVAAVAALAFVLTACSDPSAGGGATPATPGEATTPAADHWPAPDTDLSGTTLTLWAAQASNTIPESVVAAFEAKTGATVNVVTVPDPYEQGVQTRVATGDKPDLAFWQPTSSMLAALNAPTNLQRLDDAPWLANMDPSIRDAAGLLDGTRYAALISSPSVMGVFYNKAIFEANNIAIPGNWDELIAAAEQLKAAGETPFFDFISPAGWATQWAVQVQLADAAKAGLWDRVNKGEEKFTDPTIQGAINEYQRMIQDGLYNENIRTATFEDQAQALLDGKAAMAININALMGQLQTLAGDNATLDQKIGFFPISKDGQTASTNPDQSNALVAFNTGNAAQEAAARQFMAFWMGEGYADFVANQGTVSLINGVDTPADVPQLARDIHNSLADSVGGMQAQAIVNPDLFLNLSDMVAGVMTPEQVAQATQDQFAQLARAQGAEGF